MAYTILIVDDDSSQLALCEILLKRSSFAVLKATDSGHALSLLDSMTPDLIVLDYMMPDMNGFDLCKRIRNCPQTAGTPVIILLAVQDTFGKPGSESIGATAFISKLNQQKQLVPTINNILQLVNTQM